MPLPSDQLPAGKDWIAKQLADLKRQIRELRAARRLEGATISGGQGVKVANADGGPTITMTAAPGTIQNWDLSTALVFSTGLTAEVSPGFFALYLANPGTPEVSPGLLLCTPDVGNGVSQTFLYPGSPDGSQPPAAYMSAGDAEITLVPGDLEVFVDDVGGGFTYDGVSITPASGGWTALPLANGWTAYGSGFQGPQYAAMIDGTVALDGQIAPGTKTAGTTVANVDPSLAPIADHTFRVSAGPSASADIYVRSTGAVQIQDISGTVTWLSLSGIRYPFTAI